MYELGAGKENIIVKVAGGSQRLDDNRTFKFGKRNDIMPRKISWQNGVLIEAEAAVVSASVVVDR